MSKSQCELYINDQKVEFNTVPTILFTYEHSELYNPTVLRNTFSKTIDIDGTPNNNKIFNSFYDNKWVYNTSGYSPLRKETFKLYLDGELIESGYVKLDNVNKNGKSVSYSVSLYGGLGTFFFNLQTKEDSEDSLKLSDLSYPYDLNIEVNNKNVLYAWKRLNKEQVAHTPVWMGDEYKVFDFINFAPCFNGIPTDFSADKVAIDVQSFITASDEGLANQFKTNVSGYTSVNGWVLGELEKDYDEFQAFDLRSYRQRPVIRVKEIINACCNPENNGGYEVDLDKDFFNDDNPYWNDAWLTLQLLPEVKDIKEANKDDYTVNISDKIVFDGIVNGKNINVKIPVAITVDANSSANTLQTNLTSSSWDGSDESSIVDESTNFARYVQLVAYDKNDKVIGGSSVMSFFSPSSIFNFDYEPEYKSSVTTISGTYQKQSDNMYVFNKKMYNLVIDNIEYQDGMYFKIVEKFAYDSSPSVSYPSNMVLYTSSYSPVKVIQYVTDIIEEDVEIEFNEGFNWFLTKEIILNTEHTPCDYFLSYIKLFNLHIWKDKNENKIFVRQRNNYYTNNVVDLDDKVDIGGEVTVTPLNFDAKFYNFQLGMETNEMLYEDYMNEYGIPYGIQKVNTNYGFDNSTKDIFEKNIFKGCITARKMSKYNIDLHQYINEDIQYPPYMLDGCRTLLFKGDDTIEGSVISPKTSAESKQLWKDKYYSLLPMANFTTDDNKGIDGSSVLLFYNGKVETKNIEGEPIRVCITDDIPEFEQLNEGDSCWIWSYNNTIAKRPDYLPMFSRYITNENGWVTHSLDFGTPKAIYIPDYTIDESSSIYTKYWKTYIQDAYNVNTRVLDCKVLLNDNIDSTYLRNFFYFDGCYWCMHKITDYDASSNNTTKCTFIRINNLNNYLI